MREHAELLNSVRDDITESKVSTNQISYRSYYLMIWDCMICFFVQGSGGMSPRVSLLRERAAIHGNISHVRSLNPNIWCKFFL